MLALVLSSCKKDKAKTSEHTTTPYNLELPAGFPEMIIPSWNPLTEEGVKLGRHLFYDRRLSFNNSQACADCHFPQNAFSDPDQFSDGADGSVGERQAMVLQNLGYADRFFWDGRVLTLEEQALKPITDPIEMNSTWGHVISFLKNDPNYQDLFFKAFGADKIDSTHVGYALAQFERILISGNSRFDQWLRGEILPTPDEFAGFDLFKSLNGGDCFHCHSHSSRLFTDHSFKNNGMDVVLTDMGFGDVSGVTTDNGKFKVPTLRNIEYSAPYMHDGRFSTLDQVIDFYSDQVEENSPNISPLMEFANQGGVGLTVPEKQQLKAFLKSLSDPEFINNPKFASPF